jgi:hypothetical protein
MARFGTVFLLVSAVALVSGCATHEVSYREYSATGAEPDLEGHTKFKLSGSLILIETVVDEKKKTSSLSFKSVPSEDVTGDSIAIIPHKKLGITSKIGVSMRPNTMLIHDVTTEIEDKRIDTIKQIGSLIVSGIGLAGAAKSAPPQDFEGVIDLADLLSKNKRRERGDLPLPAEMTVGTGVTMEVTRITLSAISGDATDRSAYPFGTAQKSLIYSACRDATIELLHAGTTAFIGTVRVADPNFIQTVALPLTGKIEFHDQCGVSVTVGKAVTSTAPEILKAIIDQAKSIRDAQNKNK